MRGFTTGLQSALRGRQAPSAKTRNDTVTSLQASQLLQAPTRAAIGASREIDTGPQVVMVYLRPLLLEPQRTVAASGAGCQTTKKMSSRGGSRSAAKVVALGWKVVETNDLA